MGYSLMNLKASKCPKCKGFFSVPIDQNDDCLCDNCLHKMKFTEFDAEKIMEGFNDPSKPRTLSPKEKHHQRLYTILTMLRDSSEYENISLFTQDSIESALREAKQWF